MAVQRDPTTNDIHVACYNIVIRILLLNLSYIESVDSISRDGPDMPIYIYI